MLLRSSCISFADCNYLILYGTYTFNLNVNDMELSLEHKNQDAVQQALPRESQSSLAYPSRTIIHAKLEMTEPGDHNEREADAMANAIISGGKISRKISGGASGSSGIAVSQQMERQLAHLQGGGRQMPEDLRNMMEKGFGHDFSQVRLHTDGKAADMSSSIHAKAFTHGNDIYFNRGQFAPETAEGQHLVAHELTHVIQGNGRVARQGEDTQDTNYVEKVRELFAENKYDSYELSEPMSNLSEIDFYRLLCTNTNDFQAIGQTDPNFLGTLYYMHKDSFIRLRFSDLKRFSKVFTRDDSGPDFDWFEDVFTDPALHLMDRDRDSSLKISDNDKVELGSDSYHYSRQMIDDMLFEGNYDKVYNLLFELNTYDFSDLLLNNDSMQTFILTLTSDEFVKLFDKHYQALYYLYKKENKAFNTIFDSDFDLINTRIAQPRRYYFVKNALQQILKAKQAWIELSNKLQKSVREKANSNERDHRPAFLIEWFGNDDMKLDDLYNIIEYAKKDIQSITPYSDVKESCLRFAQAYPILTQARNRLDIYLQNYDNGAEQYDMIEYFMKTVCISVISAGVGSAVTAGTVANIVVSGATGATLEWFNEATSGTDLDGKNMTQSTALGVVGGIVSETISHLPKVPGPAKRFLIDVIFGSVSSVTADGIRGNTPTVTTKEKHQDEIDIALYAYYASKIGGIDYDNSEHVYYVKEQQSGEEGKQQQEIADKLNSLLKRVGE